MKRIALIQLVAAIVGLSVLLATCTSELRVRAPAPEPSADFVPESSEPDPEVRFITGRFVFGDGRAWPAATVNACEMVFPSRSFPPLPWMETVELTSDGRFRLPVHEARPDSGTRSMRISAPYPEDRRWNVIASIPLNRELPPEGLDLGDIVLDLGESLVSGRVLDEALRPIPGATQRISARTTVSHRGHWPWISTAGTWRTDEDGAFALFLQTGAARPEDPFRLETEAEGFVSERDRSVRRGERDVEVVLRRAGGLAGPLELDPGIAPADIQLLLFGDEQRQIQLRNDASFELSELPPGTYSLGVLRRGGAGQLWRDQVASIGKLVVRSGETCRDPRIQGLRIESVLTNLRIRVVDGVMAPLKGATVSFVGSALVRPALSDGDGVCRVRCAALPVDLDVSAFGYQRRRLVNVSADQEVVLDAGFEVRLRSSAAPSGDEPKYLLGAMLYSVDASGERGASVWGRRFTTNHSSDRSHFDERGELAMSLPAAGVYECDIRVTVLVDNMRRGGLVELAPNPRITVLESAAEQLFGLSIPEDAVAAAVARALR